jgi:hypothetical protein
MTNIPQTRLHDALVMGFIWAVVGVIYSIILVVMLAYFRQFDIGGIAIGLAASLAGAVGALFYGSLRLAVLATLAALIAAFGYLTALPFQAVSAMEILAVSGFAGLIVGGHYGHLMTDSRVHQATAKTLTGLYAGFVAGMPLAALTGVYGELPPALSAAVLTPLTGVLYVLALKRIIDILQGQPSPLVSGALVGGGVAGLMGIAVWAFVGIFNSTVTGGATQAVRFAWAALPEAAMGGAIGGFIAGALLAAVGMKLLGEPGENEAEEFHQGRPQGLR